MRNMFHDEHILTNGMYLPFCSFFMSCPEPPMGISGMGSFPVWSGGSLIFFQFLRCRNLALNRVFPTFLVAGKFFYSWGVWMPPMLIHHHMSIHSHPFVCPQVCTHTPYVPHYPLHLYVLRLLHVGGSMGSPYMLNTSLTPPLVWGASPSIYTPHSFIGFPMHHYVSGISVCHMGIFSL